MNKSYVFSEMIAFYDFDWFVLQNDWESQYEYTEVSGFFFDNSLSANPIQHHQGVFGMERNDTFGDLKSAIEEALEFEFEQESFLIL